MNHGRGQHSNPRMVVLVVVPVEEFLAKGARVFLATKSLWKIRSIFEGLKLAFGKGIIVRDVWPAMRFRDSQRGE